MAERSLVRVTTEVLDPSEALAWVADPSAGGTCMFVGTVRDRSGAGDVAGIVYEAWPELAEQKFGGVAGEMLERWPECRVALVHRHGELEVGEVSVVVAVSAPHRDRAFEACRYGIDRLKEEAPVWKKELLATGEAEWAAGP